MRQSLEVLGQGSAGHRAGEFAGVHRYRRRLEGQPFRTETYEGKRVKFVYKGLRPANGQPSLFKSEDPKARKVR
jgi:hypothetical protein